MTVDRFGEWVERVLIGRAEEHPRVAADDVEGSVALVGVEVDDCDPLETVSCERVACAYRNVVEETEAHGAVPARMVAGWSDGAERVGQFARDHQVNRPHHSASRVTSGLEGMGIHLGIRIDLEISGIGNVCTDPGNVLTGVRSLQLLLSHLGGFVGFEVVHEPCFDQGIVDCRQSRWRIGVVVGHLVGKTRRMGQVAGRHPPS